MIPARMQASALAGRPAKLVTRAVEHERGRAAVATARVNRVALVAQVALMRTAELSALEAQLIKVCPLGEARYAAIADMAALGMGAVVQRQALDL